MRAATATATARSARRSALRSMKRWRYRPRMRAIGAADGTEHLDAIVAHFGLAAREAREHVGRALGLACVAGVDAHRDHARERRVAQLAPILQLARAEPELVVRRGEAHRRHRPA